MMKKKGQIWKESQLEMNGVILKPKYHNVLNWQELDRFFAFSMVDVFGYFHKNLGSYVNDLFIKSPCNHLASGNVNKEH